MTTEEPKLLDHDYDGIQEYDNPLPNWWLTTFFATIIFAFLYYIHYEVAGGPSHRQELQVALLEIQKNAGPQNLSSNMSSNES